MTVDVDDDSRMNKSLQVIGRASISKVLTIVRRHVLCSLPTDSTSTIDDSLACNCHPSSSPCYYIVRSRLLCKGDSLFKAALSIA